MIERKAYKEPKIHSGHIELAVASLLNYRVHTMVPNVSWGLGLHHECDMLVMDSEARFTEVEIKISASDLKADFKKAHGHKSKIISRLVYAMPAKLFEKHSDIVPKECGVITVEWQPYLGCFKAKWVRKCKHKKTDKVPNDTVINFMRLGCMRIWSLKNHNNKTKLEFLN